MGSVLSVHQFAETVYRKQKQNYTSILFNKPLHIACYCMKQFNRVKKNCRMEASYYQELCDAIGSRNKIQYSLEENLVEERTMLIQAKPVIQLFLMIH